MTPRHSPDPSTDTKTALLDAAERLFARDGIAESSLRAITSKAGANLASVNYHFGSKEGLVRAVFARRLEPLNRQRLGSLEKCLEQGQGVTDLHCLLQAFVQPAMTMMRSQDAGDREFVKLLGRTLFEPTGELRSVVVEEFREVSERFSTAIAQALPAAPSEEIVWRFHFMVGSVAHTVAAETMLNHRLECLHLDQDASADSITNRLVDFLLSGWSGMESPATAPEEIGQ